jgi:hypothetical protein
VARVRARFVDVRVVELDASQPLSPARGRNAGWDELVRVQPQVEHVMFLDGDCELAPGWLSTATRYLDEHEDVRIVCGDDPVARG